MKKLLLILLCLPMIGFGQQTYVPDDNFEDFLEVNGMGNGISNDDYVTTANIATIDTLAVAGKSISDLTGIEAFTALTYLDCSENQLISLDVGQNTALTDLRCYINQITSLDVSHNLYLTNLVVSDNQLTNLNVSQNIALTGLGCVENQLTSLDLSQNIALIGLICGDNLLTNLDVSHNLYLTFLWCNNNLLTSLDIRNGNNTLLDTSFFCAGNSNLTCIDVDDPTWSAANWTYIDAQHSFSNNCSGTSVEEYFTNKELLKVTDLLGRETTPTNQPLFYIYDDGTVEKRIIIE